MQGLLKVILAPDCCRMHGYRNHRGWFAAMGVAVPMHQSAADKQGRSLWKIKQDVLGL